jgi:hypothetical protein
MAKLMRGVSHRESARQGAAFPPTNTAQTDHRPPLATLLLLSERSSNEAYCFAEMGNQYAVYFPNGGRVKLDLSAAKGTLQLRWLDIDRNTWQEAQTVRGGGTLELNTPGKGHWAALILRT